MIIGRLVLSRGTPCNGPMLRVKGWFSIQWKNGRFVREMEWPFYAARGMIRQHGWRKGFPLVRKRFSGS